MLFAVMLEDEPKNADARPKHREAHKAYLEKNLDKVRDAGPLLDPTSGASLGGMWLVEAENEGDVRKIVENDPFYHAGPAQIGAHRPVEAGVLRRQEGRLSAMNGKPPLQAVIVPVTPFQQNCSVVWCTKTMRGAVVDPGGEIETLLAAANERGVTIEKVLVTHGHLDHAGSIQSASTTVLSGVLVPALGGITAGALHFRHRRHPRGTCQQE